MASNRIKSILIDGIWKKNPVLVQILGLCPSLAVTASVVNALGLALATMAALILSNIVIALIRKTVTPEIRIPVFILLIASLVTVIELLVKAYLYELFLALGIFLPLIVTNCIILGRAEAFASKNSILHSFFDAIANGCGLLLIMFCLGAIRELIGTGGLFAGMDQLFGPAAKSMHISLIDNYSFLLALLPPGAFIALGFLLAAKNKFDGRRQRRNRPAAVSTAS